MKSSACKNELFVCGIKLAHYCKITMHENLIHALYKQKH